MDKKIYLTNTLSGKKELFESIFPNEITIYHCGPTVYWTQHVGNLRAVILADLFARTFLANGYKVNLIRNYTDVGHLTGDNEGDADTGEDRMEKASKRENLNPLEIAQKYITEFEEDLKALNVKTDNENDFSYQKPRATGHVQEMIKMVKVLIEKGIAYSTPLAIYFDTSKKQDYNKLSKQKIEFQRLNEGHGEIDDSVNKKNPSDFALWFFKAGIHQNALQTWPSPFHSELVENGEGFPGWHIECSAMCLSCSKLKTIDIHMGGIEHIPIHHTNEIAQSESANDAPLANYWLHNEHLLFDGGKMSKSNGTSISLLELTTKLDFAKKQIAGNYLRFFFIQSHYRSKQNFTFEAFEGAKNGADFLIHKLQDLRESAELTQNDFLNKNIFESLENLAIDRSNFYQVINDDFNFPEALAIIFKISKTNYLPNKQIEVLEELLYVLGLDFICEHGSILTDDLDDYLSDLFDERQIARQEKNWQKSDEIRDIFKKHGFELRDKKNGKTLIYRIVG